MHRVIKRIKSQLDVARSSLEPNKASPDELLGELFQDVQFRRIYADSMAFTDMMPEHTLRQILAEYKELRHEPDFNLEAFVNKHFKGYIVEDPTYKSDPSHSLEQHIEELWDVLKREEYANKGSLIGLPKPYVVAGGRFVAQFYWDSYFIMLGLAAGGHWTMVENMTKNCAYLIRKLGFVPNANRTYFASRSQPPLFALMVRLLAQHKGRLTLVRYLPAMLSEYRFWMHGKDKLGRGKRSFERVVRMPDGEVLNRYYDNKATPRPEGYSEDVHLAVASRAVPSRVYLDLRAGAESGWDFSSRWLSNPKKLSTIHTTNVVPVDLNCLLVTLELTIANAYQIVRQKRLANKYQALAEARAAAINKYMWNKKQDFYFDYDFAVNNQTPIVSAAGTLPLFAGVASDAQAMAVAATTKKRLLKAGGLVSTTLTTGQQWDSPNGWAPSQWLAVRGFRRYGLDSVADDIKNRWIKTVSEAYSSSRKLVEKYNVVDPSRDAGGGEYQLQDGFGWTNGVTLALIHEEALNWEQ